MKKILFTLTFYLLVTGSNAQVQLYGLTYHGGTSAGGTIFHYNPSAAAQTLDYSIEGGINGAYPTGNLTLSGGKFYGMTISGGASEGGVIFEWDPATNTYTKKIDLEYTSTGAYPYGSLTLKDGKFYGTTEYGGAKARGAIFEWDPTTNIYTKKIDFDYTNGGFPRCNLTLSNGKFYGTTAGGGAYESGVIFEWDPVTNIYTKKIDLNSTNGANTHCTLVLSAGKFYGITYSGGLNNAGVIFEWDPTTNIYTKKIDLDNIGGAYPQGSLSLSNGKFYGMTTYGGASGVGVIFEWDAATNIYTKKMDFTGINGANPYGSLTLSGGKFYGMATYGGANGIGVIFEWDPVTNTYAKLIDLNGDNGGLPYGDLVEYNPNPTPTISIADKLVSEVNRGTTQMDFKVTLNNASTIPVTVAYTTTNGTAIAGIDYMAANGTVTFNPGQTGKTIKVLIKGDTEIERAEKFKVILSQPVNATIADSIGVGTIKNDDPVSFAVDNNASDISKENGAVSLFLHVSPNPAKNKITVSGLSAGSANYIEFTDLNGRSLLKQKIASNIQTIDLARYAQGIYILRYFNGSNWQQLKVVKQ